MPRSRASVSAAGEAVPRHQCASDRLRLGGRSLTFYCSVGTVAGLDAAHLSLVREETDRNICKLGSKAIANWQTFLQPSLKLVPTELAFDRVLVFPRAKDRPVLLSALGASADVLLTRDETDFQGVIGGQVYGLAIRTPGQFLLEQREAGSI